MAFITFERLIRCFIFLIFIGTFVLTVNLFNIQMFTMEMGHQFLRGLLYNRNHVDLNHSDHVEDVSEIVPNKIVTQKPTNGTVTGKNVITTSVFKPDNLSDVKNQLQSEIRGLYTVLNNYIIATKYHPNYNATITLCTQGTYNFLHHITVLCTRWQGPLSVAVYAPGDDFHASIKVINRLRQCGPPCVVQNVSWHMIYDTAYPPSVNISLSSERVNCTVPMDITSTFKKDKKLLYPINVARNVARLRAQTYYVLSSDIELYPSIGIVPRFLEMVRKEKHSSIPRVYAIPIFEVKSNVKVPNTKLELIKVMKNQNAVFFHKYICDVCQRFPNRDKWLKDLPPNDTMGIFHVTKRNSALSAWEPIYIGTNQEPLYGEELSWEGKKDKMSQMFQLCMLDYDVYILNNAFLVHAPGIKTADIANQDQKRRSRFIIQNNKLHAKILESIKKKHPHHPSC